MLNMQQRQVYNIFTSGVGWIMSVLVAVRSRSLLSVTQEMNFHVRACDWFKQIFMREEFDDVELNRSDNQLATRNTLSMHIAPDIAATNISIDDSDSRHLHRRSQLA